MSTTVNNANENANAASTKADAVDTRLDNIIVESGTSDAETIAARTNTNTGITYTTLAQRLDSENSEIKEDLSQIGGGGQPKPVKIAAEMTDMESIYLYVGEEAGYDYGYVYVYIDGAWTKTSIYGRGQNGTDGADGADGADGFSPSVSVASTSTGVTISVTDKNGTTTAEVSNGTATQEQVDTWLDAHPEATTTVEDGAITRAKLNSELGLNSDLVSVSMEFVVDKTEYEGYDYVFFGSRTPTEIKNERYDVNTGEIVTGLSDTNRRIDEYFMVAPGSSISYFTPGMGIIFYNLKKEFISGVYKNTTPAKTLYTTVPDGAYYVRFWRTRTDVTNLNKYTSNVKVNSIEIQSNNLHTQWDNVDGKDDFVATVETSADITNRTHKAFKMFDRVIKSGEVIEVIQGKTYATNPWNQSVGTGNMTFYDAEMNPIMFPSTSNGIWGGFKTSSETTKPELRGRQLFTINGNIVHASHIYGNPQIYDFELPSAPAYIKINYSTGHWTVGDKTYSAEITDDKQWVLYDDDNNIGFVEQMQSLIENGILQSASTSELGRWMRFNAIKEANRKIHALRIASFNIYGAGKRKTNWASVRDTLQNYGIDLIGFQEVYDPIGTASSSDGVLFADVMASWHLSQFSDVTAFAGTSRIVAGTSDFIFVGATDTVYDTQANYGSRAFCRAEFRLPRWKGKNWSNYIKVSVYNTQLEVGTSAAYTNARLAQARQLTAAMKADPNPFVVLVGDFNEMSTDRSTFAAIEAEGFTPVLADTSTPTSYRGFYDNIFVNDRISIINDDVIPFSDNGSGLSDHNLLFADLVFDYTNIIAVKKTGENCTIGVEDWLDRRITDPVTIEITPDEGYTVSAITVGQGDNDLTYTNGAIAKSGNTITVIPNLVVGDMWISVTTAAAT